MTPDDWAIEAAKRRDAQRERATPKRGKTPEAKVSAAIDRYLTSLTPRPIAIRANAGAWKDDSGHMIMGAKAGTSDKVCCIAGAFVALEIKSATGVQTEAQRRFQARVEALGGLYILARSAADVRAALVERFGEATVKGWETRR